MYSIQLKIIGYRTYLYIVFRSIFTLLSRTAPTTLARLVQPHRAVCCMFVRHVFRTVRVCCMIFTSCEQTNRSTYPYIEIQQTLPYTRFLHAEALFFFFRSFSLFKPFTVYEIYCIFNLSVSAIQHALHYCGALLLLLLLFFIVVAAAADFFIFLLVSV